MYFHLFRKNKARPDVTCDLPNGTQTQGMLSAICWCRNQWSRTSISAELSHRETAKKIHLFHFFLLFWPDSSSARSVLQWSCKSLHLNGCALGKIQEGFHSLCFIFLPETEVQRWYFSSQQTDMWSCSLKWIEQTENLVFLLVLFPSF